MLAFSFSDIAGEVVAEAVLGVDPSLGFAAATPADPA